MDTSEQYIKMCDCPEIQGGHKFEDGDIYWWSVDGGVHLAYTENHPDYYVQHPEQWDMLRDRKCIWLPRQDQLQETVEDKRVELQIIVKKFCDFIHFPLCYDWNIEIKKYLPKFSSMEQLWLAFYMKEAHNKVWDGNKWE